VQNIDNLRTERLTLRRMTVHDLDAVSSLYRDPDAMSMLGGVQSPEESRRQAGGLLDHWNKYNFGTWIAIESVSSRFVGIGGTRQVFIQNVAETDIGYMLLKGFWGQGLATELAATSVQIGFAELNFPSLVADPPAAHVPSRRVLEKIGFAFEREFMDWAGVPQALYRLTQPTWRQKATSAP
jgi:[ribosomal protein S5]-alanine N-acetyltransferase